MVQGKVEGIRPSGDQQWDRPNQKIHPWCFEMNVSGRQPKERFVNSDILWDGSLQNLPNKHQGYFVKNKTPQKNNCRCHFCWSYYYLKCYVITQNSFPTSNSRTFEYAQNRCAILSSKKKHFTCFMFKDWNLELCQSRQCWYNLRTCSSRGIFTST